MNHLERACEARPILNDLIAELRGFTNYDTRDIGPALHAASVSDALDHAEARLREVESDE